MAANAIGTGAVVLTANADKLLSGLDSAQKHTERFAARTAKSATAAGTKGGGGGGGGLFGSLLFGAKLGSGIGAALAGFQAANAAIDTLVNKFANISEVAQRYGNIDVARTLRIDRTQKAFDRIGAAFDDVLLKAAERLAPVFERVADVVERVLFVASELAGEVWSVLTEVVDTVVKWADETFNLGLQYTKFGQTVFDVLRGIGKGFAYALDAAKWFAGQALKGFAAVTGGAADLLRALGADEWAAKADGLALKLDGIGRGWADGFGSSVKQVDAWFDRMEAKFDSTQRLAKATGVALAGAFSKGSAEAYSVLAKFQAGNILTGQSMPDNPVKIAKEQLKEAREQKRVLWKIVGVFDRGTPIRIIE